jgi:hypothetical protein
MNNTLRLRRVTILGLNEFENGIEIFRSIKQFLNGFGGLVVSMLASGSRVRGIEPDRSRWIFSDVKKNLSMPSFGGEVK